MADCVRKVTVVRLGYGWGGVRLWAWFLFAASIFAVTEGVTLEVATSTFQISIARAFCFSRPSRELLQGKSTGRVENLVFNMVQLREQYAWGNAIVETKTL